MSATAHQQRTPLVYQPDKRLEALDKFYSACAAGQLKEVRSLLEGGSIAIKSAKKGTSGSTPLMVAAFHGRVDVMEYLMRVPGVDVNAVDVNGWTALRHAVESFYKTPSSTAAIALLLRSPDIDVDKSIYFGFTPLTRAILYQLEKVVNLLIDGPRTAFAHPPQFGATLLQYILKANDTEGVRALLRKLRGVHLHNPTEEHERQALCVAWREGRTEVCRLLLRYFGQGMLNQGPLPVVCTHQASATNVMPIVRHARGATKHQGLPRGGRGRYRGKWMKKGE